MARGSNVVCVVLNNIAVVACCLLLVSAPAGIEAAVTCSEVTNWLTPCISYAVYGGEVGVECCAGLKTLSAASTTTEDRRNACSCLKDGVSSIPWVNYDLVAALPAKCGITSPYQIAPSTDCSKVN